MPVVHQVQIVCVVVANLLESVGKFLPTRKQLFEVRKAGCHGCRRASMTSRWEDRLDEANVDPVVWHLVDKEGLIRSIGARAIEIALA